LALGGNQLTGGIPSQIGNLGELKILYLDHNKLSGPITKELANLKNLEVLFLDNNNFDGGITLPPRVDPINL
jgi:Leucine-rich repeat (LRR) protein